VLCFLADRTVVVSARFEYGNNSVYSMLLYVASVIGSELETDSVTTMPHISAVL